MAPVTFKKWHRGEPNNVGRGGEDCTEIGLFNDETWNDIPCSHALYFFCDARPFVLNTGAVKNFHDARKYCQQKQGTDLAIVPDQATNAQMWQALRTLPMKRAYIGYDDLMNEGRFTWVDGRSRGFTRWHRGEPNNVGRGGEDCTEIGLFNDDTWNDIPCGHGLHFFCDALPSKVETEGFILVANQRKNFRDARAFCRATYGTDLAVVPNQKVNSEMWAALSKLPFKRAYIGYEDTSREGKFQWVDGKTRRYTRWHRGEPNNVGRNGEDCTEIGLFNDDTWNDINCATGLHFFCAKRKASKRVAEYELVQEAKTFNEARQYCQVHFGTDLAVIPNEETNNAMWAELRVARSRRAYVGYEDRSKEGKFQWVDGVKRSYKKWHRGEPNNVGRSGEDCTEMGLFNDPTWNDINCNARLFFFCDKRKPKAFVLISDRKKNYQQARDYCRSHYGTDLATIPNQRTNAAMWAELKKQSFKRAFFGFDDKKAEGKFKWVDGKQRSFTRWHRGEPNNVGRGGEDCAELGRFNDDTWNDIPCSQSMHFFCAVNQPKRGLRLDGEFELVRTRRNYQQARDYCRSRYGTDLAVIPNEKRNEEMWQVLKKSGYHYAWFGLSDLDQEGKFKWTDGVKRSYTKWHRGEPNDWGRREDCAEMGFFRSSTWNDMNCATARYFFCAKAPVIAERKGFTLVQGKFTWPQANDYCRREFGGALASPRSAAQNAQMNDAVNRLGSYAKAWIGANDRRRQRKFVQANGQPLAYKKFARGEPSFGATHNCAQMGAEHDGKWNDYDCDDVADGFICENRGCPHNCAQCRASGDPHYNTFDGLEHHFNGRCAYHYVVGCQGAAAKKKVPFDLVGIHRPAGAYAALDSLVVRFYGKNGKEVERDPDQEWLQCGLHEEQQARGL